MQNGGGRVVEGRGGEVERVGYMIRTKLKGPEVFKALFIDIVNTSTNQCKESMDGRSGQTEGGGGPWV